MRNKVLIFIIGLALGAAVGVGIGWLAPVTDVGAGFDKLTESYKAEYTVMVGAAFAVDGDWDAAQGRLGLLGEPEVSGYVARLAERSIAEGRNPDDIRNLVRLAARLGAISAPMQPYLESTESSAP